MHDPGAFAQAEGSHIPKTKSLDDRDSEEVLSMAKPRQPYSLGSDVELSLRTNELRQLDCHTAADGGFSCVVFRGDAMVNMLFASESGDVLSRGGSSVTKQQGAIRQVGDLPYLVIATWTLAGDDLKL